MARRSRHDLGRETTIAMSVLMGCVVIILQIINYSCYNKELRGVVDWKIVVNYVTQVTRSLK